LVEIKLVVLEKKSFKVKVDARQTDVAPCHKLTWPFGPGELTNYLDFGFINKPQIDLMVLELT